MQTLTASIFYETSKKSKSRVILSKTRNFFMLSTDIIKISLFVRDDKLLISEYFHNHQLSGLFN